VLTLSNRLIEPAKLLLIVGIAYTLASTGWYFVSDPIPTPLANPTRGAQSSRPAALPLERILAANLFGASSGAPAATPSTYDAPETRLRLTLEGVFRAEDPGHSAAIIAEQGRPGELYHVGQTLPGNVELTEVHADRVVLRRGGMYETLKFPEETALLAADQYDESLLPTGETYPDEPVYEEPAAVTEGSNDAQMLMQRDSNSTRAGLQNYIERLESDPAGALSELGVSAVSSGSAQGYKLDNLANSPYLAQTGLQPGDVVLSVNGRPVGDVQQDRLEIDNILAQGSARIEVQRGERRFFVTASLP